MGNYFKFVPTDDYLPLLRECAGLIEGSVEGQRGRGLSGVRPTQYHLDLAADNVAVDFLVGAGFRVVSEESGTTGVGDVTVVIDPIDGSTNCDRGVPFYATSLAVVRKGELVAGLVRNLATGATYEAVLGGGAVRDGVSIRPSGQTDLQKSLVAFSGLPDQHRGWAQMRALGAASLECCLVADGSLDIFAVARNATLYPWDYLAGLLIAREAGAVARDMGGADLVTTEATQLRPIFAATEMLVTLLLAAGPT